MASSTTGSSDTKHVAVFPPRPSVVCALEIWSDTKSAKAVYAIDESVSSPCLRTPEPEEAERWDGMS